MNRKIFLLSSDNDFTSYIHTSALTLTKLNHQINFTDNINDRNIDIIIIDLDSRGKENLEIIKKIRKSPDTSKIKILAVSTSVTEDLKSNVFNAGCDAVMSKSEFRAAADNILIF